MKASTQFIDRWTESDVRSGRCAPLDIGRPKPLEVETAQEVFEALPPATLSEFKQAVLRVARDQYGSYDTFLKAHPGFHQKFLLSMAREAVPSTPPDNTIKDIPWLNRDRLSYQYKDPNHPNHDIYLESQKDDARQVEDAKLIERKP